MISVWVLLEISELDSDIKLFFIYSIYFNLGPDLNTPYLSAILLNSGQAVMVYAYSPCDVLPVLKNDMKET